MRDPATELLALIAEGEELVTIQGPWGTKSDDASLAAHARYALPAAYATLRVLIGTHGYGFDIETLRRALETMKQILKGGGVQ